MLKLDEPIHGNTNSTDAFKTGYAANQELWRDELNRLTKSPPPRVVIWGATSLCKRILACFENMPSGLTIWDTNLAGGYLSGHEIKPPELEIPESEAANNSLIFLAFNMRGSYESCAETLSSLGYKNIIHGIEFINKIILCKIGEDYEKYKSLNKDNNFVIDDRRLFICAGDMHSNAGSRLNNDYLVQDLWAARKIHSAAPPVHYDIGSRVDGFITHLLSFEMKTVLIDIRPLETYGTENLTFIQEDATLLSGLEDNSVQSLSALCSLEHFGLGRYGDPLDPEAHNKAFFNIQRVMKKGGDLYISVPVSDVCALHFNAHRVYSPYYILERFNSMELAEFSLASPKGLIRNAPLDGINSAYAVGLFHFRKK